MTDFENVPSPRLMPEHRKHALADLLKHEVRRARHPFGRFRRRTLTIGAGALALVLAGGAAASAYVAFRPVDDNRAVQCFPTSDTDTESHVVYLIRSDGSDGQDPDQRKGEPLPINDPVAQCEAEWENGVLRPGSTAFHNPAQAGAKPRPVPRLVACTLDSGIAGVFPGDSSTCERLGLPRAIR